MEPHKGLKCYDTKFFAGIDFYDYWNLEKRPAYISANKTKAPYIKLDSMPFENSQKVSSLSDIATYMRKNEWTFEPRYLKKINPYIQAFLNVPFS